MINFSNALFLRAELHFISFVVHISGNDAINESLVVSKNVLSFASLVFGLLYLEQPACLVHRWLIELHSKFSRHSPPDQ